MNVLIIEDEAPALRQLIRLLQAADPQIQVQQTADSVEAAVRYLKTGAHLDLIFMDIQLADGLSFDIFEQVAVTVPVIFTTAFDQYTLKAFRVNSVDYLLKPIEESALQAALQKFRDFHQRNPAPVNLQMLDLLRQIQPTRYRERILIQTGQQLHFLRTDEVAYCFADGKYTYVVNLQGNKVLVDYNLTQLEEQLDPAGFFRINRQLLVHINAIQKVHTWLGGRLKLDLTLPTQVETLVSRDKVQAFKEWLGR